MRNWMLRGLPLLFLFALPFVTSCGGAMQQRPDERQEPQRDPHAVMDEQEARIREGREALEAAGATCETRCRAGGSICDAAHRICAIAADLGEDAAQARCDSAQASCLEANQALTACSCPREETDGGLASGDQGQGFIASCSSTDA
jgi:hypothetical protein